MLEETKHRFKSSVDDIDKSCQGRHWPLRLVLLGWFSYMLVWHLHDADYQSWLSLLNLGLHQFGHLAAIPLGDTWSVLGGTLCQLAVPLLCLCMFRRQGDYFAVSFGLVWLGSNLFGISRYVGDARTLAVRWVSPFGGGEAIHDWNYLLHKMGWLNYDASLALLARWGAIASMVLGILWGLWTLALMMRRPTREIAEGCSSSEA